MTSSLLAVSFDCADAGALATFWAGVLGRDVDDGPSIEFASIGLNGRHRGPAWFFIKVPEGAAAKNRFHPDLGSPDLDAESIRVVALGATQHATFDEGGHHWTTFTDPEGNVFDIVAT